MAGLINFKQLNNWGIRILENKQKEMMRDDYDLNWITSTFDWKIFTINKKFFDSKQSLMKKCELRSVDR